jgi:hypothetical protein
MPHPKDVYTVVTGAITLSITTFSITALSIKGLFATLSITVSHDSNTVMLSVILLTVSFNCYAECRCAECRGALLTCSSGDKTACR